jgi:UDP-N-acetylglucosamine 2-epimerase (non-hydrolysing)
VILICFGTRPEYIKIKPIIEKIRGSIPYKLLFTGQHLDLLSNIQEETIRLSIKDGPNRLDSIVTSVLDSDTPFNTGELSGVEYVLIQGDTSSAFAIALGAFHKKIKIIHLEAGLRTYNKDDPYPEEFNRQCISRMADIHLCPTKTAAQNLIAERVSGQIYVVGNTVLDNLVGINSTSGDKVVVTMHRRENHHNLDKWFLQINELAKNNKNLDFIIPLHPNPNVQKHAHLLTELKVISPLEYRDFITLLASSKYVVTDSGGLQEESCFFKKPCLVCRKTTERVEGLGDFSLLCESPLFLNERFEQLKKLKMCGESLYGDGNASEKIKDILLKL